MRLQSSRQLPLLSSFLAVLRSAWSVLFKYFFSTWQPSIPCLTEWLATLYISRMGIMAEITDITESILQMHKNRLVQLTQISERSGRVGSKLKEPLVVEKTSSEFDPLANKIRKFSIVNEEISDMLDQYKKTVNPTKQKQFIHQATLLSQKNSKLMHQIEEEVKKINDKLKKDIQKGDKSNKLKVMKITQSAHKAITEFKDNQQKFTDRVKDNIRRQATIIQGQITQEEVEDIMANPEKGQQMLEAKLLNSPSVQLENAVSDIIDKYRDILALEKSMHQCFQMMQELALLVTLQGEQLDSIETTIDQTGGYMAVAEEKLVKAKGHHKSAKKKMCCIIMLLLAVIGAILIPVLITQL